MRKRIHCLLLAALVGAMTLLLCLPASATDDTDPIRPLHIEGNDFVDDAGNVVKFWGFNLVALYPTATQAEAIAEQLAALGVNVVRPHHNMRNSKDWNWGDIPGALVDYVNDSRTPDPVAWENFDYLNYQLRKKGIYTRPSLDASRRYLPGDVAILETTEEDAAAWSNAMAALERLAWNESMDLRRILPMIDERCALLNEEYIKNFLTHTNEHTGLTYGEDPQTLTLEIMNETSTPYAIYAGNRFENYIEREPDLQYWYDLFVDRFEAYCSEHGMEPFDFLTTHTNDLTLEQQEFRDNFLVELDNNYYERIQAFVKNDLQCDIPITFSNLFRGEHVMQTYAEGADYIEAHSYPNPFVAETKQDLFYDTAQSQIADMPYFIGELNQTENFSSDALAQDPDIEARYKAHRTMLPLATAAYGAFSDWAGVNFFAWCHGSRNLDQDGYALQYDRTPNDRSYMIGEIQSDGMMLDHMRTTGIIFKKGLVRESVQPFTLYVDDPVWISNYAGTLTYKYPIQVGWQSIHAVRKSYTDGSIPFSQLQSSILTEETPSTLISDTNEIIKDTVKKQLIISAPQAEAFSGDLGGQPAAINHLSVSASDGNATVVLVADDDTPIGESKKLILSATGVQADMTTEYNPVITLSGLRAGTWEMKLTRAGADSGSILRVQTDASGNVTLPTMGADVPWNECELTYVQNFAFEGPLFSDGTGAPLAQLPLSGGTVQVALEITNNTGSAADMAAILALYQNGALLSMSINQDTLRPGANAVETDALTVPEATPTELATVTDTAFTDTRLTSDTRYRYVIEAYQGDSLLSSIEQDVKTLGGGGNAPAAPSNLTPAYVSADTIGLQWEPSGTPYVQYAVYRDGAKIATVSGTCYHDTSLAPNAAYTYEVRALRGSTESTGTSLRIRTAPYVLAQMFDDAENSNFAVDRTLSYGVRDSSTANPNTPQGDYSYRLAADISTTSDTPTQMMYYNYLFQRNNAVQSCDLTEYRDTASLHLFINPRTPRQRNEIGLVSRDANGAYSFLRVDLSDYVDLGFGNYMPGNWRELYIPLSDLAQKGIYDQNGSSAPQFDWTNVAGFSLACSDEAYAGQPGIHWLAIDDYNLVLNRPAPMSASDEAFTLTDLSEDTISYTWTPAPGADRYVIKRYDGLCSAELFVWDSLTGQHPYTVPFGLD